MGGVGTAKVSEKKSTSAPRNLSARPSASKPLSTKSTSLKSTATKQPTWSSTLQKTGDKYGGPPKTRSV